MLGKNSASPNGSMVFYKSLAAFQERSLLTGGNPVRAFEERIVGESDRKDAISI